MSIQSSCRYKPEVRRAEDGKHQLIRPGASAKDGELSPSGEHILNPKYYQQILFERRLMFASLVSTVLSFFLFLISIATHHWVRVWIHAPVPAAESPSAKVNLTTILQIGIWFEHRVRKFDNGTETESYIMHFPAPPSDVVRLESFDLPHYYRTQAVFSMIGLVIMIAGNFCAFYSFRQTRYMYKRLTAGLFGFVAMCVLVVVEVMVHHVQQWSYDKMTGGATRDAVEVQESYGFSTILAWIVFAVYVVAVFVFIYASRKKKGSRAGTQELEIEDRPVQLGR